MDAGLQYFQMVRMIHSEKRGINMKKMIAFILISIAFSGSVFAAKNDGKGTKTCCSYKECCCG